MKNVKKNFIYSVFYQILAIIIPMITIPYVSRKLGVTGVGSYSYTYSIAYYFMITAMLGINNYGSREIAKHNGDLKKTSRSFWSIYYFQALFSIVVILIYILYVILFANEFKTLMIIQGLYVLSSLFDINWFYSGIEKFKVTVTRNSIIKILSLILILLLVKKESDVYIYTSILAGSTLLSNVILFLFLKGNVTFEKVKFKELFKHLKPCLILFIPVIAMKIYKVMDRTMLGTFASIDEVGYYSNAVNIINVPMGIIIALGSVMLPRITNLLANNKNKEAEKVFNKSITFAVFLMLPITVGLCCVAKDFSILFFGEKFERTGIILSILSITIMFMTFANVIRTQYLIPNHKDKEYIISVIIGAIVNVIFNLIFIKKYQAIGACIGTIVAEFIVMASHIYYYNKKYKFINILKNCKWIIFSAFIMLIYLVIINNISFNSLLFKLFIEILGACIIYFVLNIKYILNLVNFKKILTKVFSKNDLKYE